MNFIKWNHKFAYGNSPSDIEIVYFSESDIELIKEWCEEKCRDYDFSEKYRGIDYEFIDKPPKTWLINSIKKHERLVKFHLNTIEMLNNFLDIL